MSSDTLSICNDGGNHFAIPSSVSGICSIRRAMKACVSAVLLASSLMAWGAAIQAEPLTVAQIKELLHRRDSGAGLREVEAAAEVGDPNAQLFLATLYLGEGKGPKHAAEVDKWLHSAAASGNLCAMTMLGLHGVEGVGIEVGNAPEALQWLKKAAVRGHRLHRSSC